MQLSGPVLVPSPSSPYSFSPQAMTVPSSSSARLCDEPAAIALTPLSPATRTGVVLQAVEGRSKKSQNSGPLLVPLPSWPKEFSPHDMTVPSSNTARLVSPPAAAALTPLNPLAATGVSLQKGEGLPTLLAPLPGCPYASMPQPTAPEVADAGSTLARVNATAIAPRTSADQRRCRPPAWCRAVKFIFAPSAFGF